MARILAPNTTLSTACAPTSSTMHSYDSSIGLHVGAWAGGGGCESNRACASSPETAGSVARAEAADPEVGAGTETASIFTNGSPAVEFDVKATSTSAFVARLSFFLLVEPGVLAEA